MMQKISIENYHTVKRNYHHSEWQLINFADQADAVFNKNRKDLGPIDGLKSMYHHFWYAYHNKKLGDAN